MRLILRIYERVPLLCKNLVTEPEETSIARLIQYDHLCNLYPESLACSRMYC